MKVADARWSKPRRNFVRRITFKLRLGDRAFEDLREAVAYIVEASGKERADRWLTEAMAEIRTLDEMPNRCPLVPEPELAALGFRHLIFHAHRIVFEVVGDEVLIARVYHSRRDRLRSDASDDGA